ncbi:hypothetical protein K402DRAFT_425762 [Aulographum hederae CBS 113979]|uniref:MADS-box domain-containing protein n=1 Tax=Aulographum hederae CBS 113979 TaxID=1176131 RepID=A0A6G1GJC6_9PEZI|nr:hypothetical protein K402DRAFT_425762 [Aulographum hederae CBS 113979]
MGRRKIEIKAIKDDRNRSVTFLKRKGGLFKKAHELSVLCSVDVAVIIFGHNKKLYEFSSGDINETIGRFQYYGGAHEHKGPEDFMGKKDGDEDDEDEEVMGSPPPGSHSPPDQLINAPPPIQNQAPYQHMRHHTPSASPPMHANGLPQQFRTASPQPPISRPQSRAAQPHIRRTSSNLAPPQPGHGQGSYAYMPNPPIYNPQATPGMRPQPPPGHPYPPQHQYTHPPPHVQQPHPQQHPQHPQHPPHPQQHPQQHPQHPQQHPQQPQQPQHPQHPQQMQHGQHPQHPQQMQHAQHSQVQQAYAQDQRRQSMPPNFPSQQQDNRQGSAPVPSPPQPEQNNFQSPPLPQPKPLPAAAKNHSIFTPIDDSRSLLAQHWGSSSTAEVTSNPAATKTDGGPRSQSIDVASMNRRQANGRSSPNTQPSAPPPPPLAPARTASTSSVPTIAPPSRTNSMQSKPRLKVQIPSEHSDSGEQTADGSPRDTTAATMTPVRSNGENHGSGVVLPPPSPSASALLSAGASGPPNPFARPAPPPNGSQNFAGRSDMETPISALPSRFVADQLLPSPSSFYPEWFGRSDNTLPSPLTFQTPVAANGPSFKEENDPDRKRKTSDDSNGSSSKRIKA